MVTVHDTRTVTDAFLVRIQTAVTCGDAVKPSISTTAQGLPTEPYAVLYPLPDLDSGGSLNDAHQWHWRHFQITVVGGSRQQAEFGQNLVRETVSGWVPTVADVACGPVELDDPTGVERDDDVNPPVFYTTDRFRLFVS